MSVTRREATRSEPAAKTESAATVRATISFPAQIYETLEEIAKSKKVSLAWVVREATERYVTDQWPLFAALKPHE
jgi:hypothetical protein